MIIIERDGQKYAKASHESLSMIAITDSMTAITQAAHDFRHLQQNRYVIPVENGYISISYPDCWIFFGVNPHELAVYKIEMQY